jgi:hypothetical protein
VGVELGILLNLKYSNFHTIIDYMDRLKVYVQSFEVPTVGFVDKEGAMHACAQAQKTAFQGLERHAGLFGNRYLSDEDREVLMRIEGYCKNNGLEYEVVDVGSMGFLARVGLRMKGIKAPAICSGEKTLCGIPSDEDIKKFLSG